MWLQGKRFYDEEEYSLAHSTVNSHTGVTVFTVIVEHVAACAVLLCEQRGGGCAPAPLQTAESRVMLQPHDRGGRPGTGERFGGTVTRGPRWSVWSDHVVGA